MGPAAKTEATSPFRATRSSESSESGDSLLQSSSSSSEVTPVGTPSACKKSGGTGAGAKKGFSREELIAKYGEEIFSVSNEVEEEATTSTTTTTTKRRVDSPMVRSKFAGGGGGGVGAICRGLEARMRIFEKES